MNDRGYFQQISGFTLLEVMISLAILSLVGVAFLRAQASSVHLVDESAQISLATLMAREKMAELESIGYPELGKKSGGGEEPFPQYSWEQTVSSTDIVVLRKAVIRVSWVEGATNRTLELVAYFAQK